MWLLVDTGSLPLLFFGAFAPAIAQGLAGAFGAAWPVGAYIAALSLVSLAAVSTIRDPRDVDLHVGDEDAPVRG